MTTIEYDSYADTVAAAARIGYPVVLKGGQQGVAHKNDLGLAHVGLDDPKPMPRVGKAIP